MVNQKDILAALQNGQDPEVLAQSFVDALNAAIAEKAAADEKAAKSQEKEKRMSAIVDLTLDFMRDFYPEIYEDGMREAVDIKALIRAMDEARDEVVKMQPMLDDLAKLVADLDPEMFKNTPRHAEKKVATNPIEDFLKANGLKM